MFGSKLTALTAGLLLGASAIVLTLSTNSASAQPRQPSEQDLQKGRDRLDAKRAAERRAEPAAEQGDAARLAAARAVRIAATTRYYDAGAKYTQLLICGTKPQQDAAKKELDTAKKELDIEIHNEAEETPESTAAFDAENRAARHVDDFRKGVTSDSGLDSAGGYLKAQEAVDAAHEHRLQVVDEQVKRITAEVEAGRPAEKTPQCPGHETVFEPPPAPDTGSAPRQTGVRSGMVTADYGNFKPKFGPGENQYSIGGSIQFDPRNIHIYPSEWGRNSSAADPIPASLGNVDWPIIQIDAKFAHVDSSAIGIDIWTVGATAYFTTADWQFGPAFRFQSQSSGGFSTQTFDYGAFAQWFATDRITAVANIGGFSGDFSNNGFYTGGTLKGYPTADTAVFGGVDYARFTSFGGSDEEDYTIGGEALLSETTPFSIYAGYSYNAFAFGSHDNTVFVGFNFYFNSEGTASLVDRQRSGQIRAYSNRFSGNTGSR